MSNHRKSNRWWATDAEEKRKIERQRWRNNFIGIFILILMLFMAFDIGGCSSMLSNFLLQQ